MKICVLGGRGAMGKVIVSCLLRHDPGVQITVADRVLPGKKEAVRQAQEGEESHPCQSDLALERQKAEFRRVGFKKVDLRNHAALVRVLRGHAVVINSTSHHFNLPVMRAALAAGVHYMDLGGLFHFTRRQLRFHQAFRKRNLTAILGMGCAPGISNIMALWAAQKMDRVDEIHIKVGSRELFAPSSVIRPPCPEFVKRASSLFPYAVGTIREELTWKPAIYRRGRLCFEKPLHGVELFKFPRPVGKQRIFWTIHSEIATLPRSFPRVTAASFKIGFPEEIIKSAIHPSTPPKEDLSAIAPSCRAKEDCEITLALVRGRNKGKAVMIQAWCRAFSAEGHSAGDWDTAWPPALASCMLARNEIESRGVFPPEKLIPLEPFLEKLRTAGFDLKCKTL